MDMPEKPSIPMTPNEVRQEKLRLVVDLPARPASFEAHCNFVYSMNDTSAPKGSPRKVEYVGTVEWAESPLHSRIDSYYLNSRGKHWLLWNYYLDENSWSERWVWVLYAYGPRKGVDPKTAALYLLMDAWREETCELDLRRFFLVDNTGLVSRHEFLHLANLVWPQSGEDGQQK